MLPKSGGLVMSAAASVKTASADSPIHEVLAERWSPYAFRDKPVSQDELRSLFEAARWAPSSYNEQPWRYVVATRDDRAQFERLLSCLVVKRSPAFHCGVCYFGQAFRSLLLPKKEGWL